VTTKTPFILDSSCIVLRGFKREERGITSDHSIWLKVLSENWKRHGKYNKVERIWREAKSRKLGICFGSTSHCSGDSENRGAAKRCAWLSPPTERRTKEQRQKRRQKTTNGRDFPYQTNSKNGLCFRLSRLPSKYNFVIEISQKLIHSRWLTDTNLHRRAPNYAWFLKLVTSQHWDLFAPPFWELSKVEGSTVQICVPQTSGMNYFLCQILIKRDNR